MHVFCFSTLQFDSDSVNHSENPINPELPTLFLFVWSPRPLAVGFKEAVAVETEPYIPVASIIIMTYRDFLWVSLKHPILTGWISHRKCLVSHMTVICVSVCVCTSTTGLLKCAVAGSPVRLLHTCVMSEDVSAPSHQDVCNKNNFHQLLGGRSGVNYCLSPPVGLPPLQK